MQMIFRPRSIETNLVSNFLWNFKMRFNCIINHEN